MPWPGRSHAAGLFYVKSGSKKKISLYDTRQERLFYSKPSGLFRITKGVSNKLRHG
jgi:hypothetical protein